MLMDWRLLSVHLGWKVVGLGRHRLKEVMVSPPDTAVSHPDEVIPGVADAHDIASSVPLLCSWVLDTSYRPEWLVRFGMRCYIALMSGSLMS